MKKKQPKDQSANQEQVVGAGATEMKEEAQDPQADAPQQEQLEQENTMLQQQLEELKDKYMRMYADFDNYKKRMVKEKLDLINTAAQDTLSSLLPVLDDFDRAKKNAEAGDSKEHFSEGIALVYQKLYSVLRQKGLEEIDANGQAFDPELHEAFTEIPAPSDELKGKIVDTIEKGYKLNDRIIRHPKVVVGK
ncbi:MAG: nucleotide exchange factor GrpE [Saprospirales bacterium]|nr:nucleotide exchange factor GrpE [Saprospirales bacterium]